jgi:hypothetical protein
MELRWYWRVIRRHLRLIIIPTVIIALFSIAQAGYSYYTSSSAAVVVLQFTQPIPIITGQNLTMDPVQYAQNEASLAVGNAKAYSKRHEFFVTLSHDLKATYGMNIDWKVIGAHFGADITDPNRLELHYVSSNETRSKDIVLVAMNIIQRDFLPIYIASEKLPVSPLSKITQGPIQMSVYDPLFQPPNDITKLLTGFGIKTLIGLPLGVALAFLWEYLDQSIVDVQDVRNWMGAPALGVIPVGRPTRDR